MRKLFITIVLFISTSVFASDIKWEKDFPSGMKESVAQNKPTLFVFSRHTCKYCVVLDETTFKDKKVIEALNKDFVSIISYSDENDYTPQELWRPGTPTIWFLLPSGEPMFQPIMGAVDASNFLNALEIVKKEFSELQKNTKTK